METCMDFRIYQRNSSGYAVIPFGGCLPENLPDDTYITARVIREEDNLIILYGIPCATDGKTYHVNLTVPEGGLYRIEAVGMYGVIHCVHHIGVGDIFVTCGQSNMTGYGKDSAYDPPVLGVHMLANTGNWTIASHPIACAVNSIYAFPENSTGTSPALSFARRLKERLGVPIGIIPSAVVGTKLEQWNPAQTGDCCREMYRRLDAIGEFKGFLWYQGCSDANETAAPSYFERFSETIAAWREKYGHHPVLTVQLNRWASAPGENRDKWWGMIRDAQRRAGLELEDVVTVPSLDLPMTDGIHNSAGANVIIGERLANVALHYFYHKPGQEIFYIHGAKQIDATHLALQITPRLQIEALNGHMDNRAEGMEVEDAAGLISCVEAIVDEDSLIVSTSRPFSLPAMFHYAWKSCATPFPARDPFNLPLLACYRINIEPIEKT